MLNKQCFKSAHYFVDMHIIYALISTILQQEPGENSSIAHLIVVLCIYINVRICKAPAS
jgi:hypothetical protein